MADAADPGELEARVGGLDAPEFRPFLLLAVSPSEARLWTWDGIELVMSEPDLPLTSSSFRSDEVTAARRRAFRKLGDLTPEKLAEFHSGHDPERPEFSVRMRRDDARTVSQSRIDVGGEGVTFTYRPEPDDSLAVGEEMIVTIPRG